MGEPGTAANGTGGAVPRTETGGDPVCWLSRVCPECGAIADSEPPAVCPRCHSPITGD